MESLGTILREAREKLNLTLEEISEKLKIRQQFLMAIEDDNLDILPQVYVKSFIKSYATLLKINLDELPKEVLSKHNFDFNENGVKQHTKNSKTKLETNSTKPYSKKVAARRKQSLLIHYFIYSGLVLAAAALLYFSLFSNGDSGNKGFAELGTQSDTAVAMVEKDDLKSFFATSDSLVLEAEALDTAWLRIDIDGKFSDPSVLYPGNSRRWSAMNYFTISLGNAGSVVFKRDGQKLPFLGPKGTVVRNVKITRTSVETSAMPKPTGQRKVEEKRKSPPAIEPSNPKPLNPIRN